MSDARRVLVVDDERQILRALRVMLRDADFEVVTAQRVQEALDAAALRGPDAAIVDLILPDGNGIDVCLSIREWSQMPILVLSAVGEEGLRQPASSLLRRTFPFPQKRPAPPARDESRLDPMERAVPAR